VLHVWRGVRTRGVAHVDARVALRMSKPADEGGQFWFDLVRKIGAVQAVFYTPVRYRLTPNRLNPDVDQDRVKLV
jgi:hypothetical protein